MPDSRRVMSEAALICTLAFGNFHQVVFVDEDGYAFYVRLVT
jgi:hypothetical protein